MSDLISRDALLEAISNTWEESNSLSIINLIANAPAIEQGEVVGYIDEFGNFENSLKQWIVDEPDVKWKPLYTTPQHPQEQGELVKKAVADALEEAAKICDDLEYKNNRYDCAGCGDAIRTIIKRNAEECQ